MLNLFENMTDFDGSDNNVKSGQKKVVKGKAKKVEYVTKY